MNRPSRLLALLIDRRRDFVALAARLTGDVGSAEDVVQDAWLRISGLDPGREVIEPVGYLRRLVRNLALDQYRQRVRREQVTALDGMDSHERIDATAIGADRMLIAAQELALVTAELARMPAQMRRAVELHRISGATLREIAEDLGLSVTTAHKLVTDGVERCRQCLRRAKQ